MSLLYFHSIFPVHVLKSYFRFLSYHQRRSHPEITQLLQKLSFDTGRITRLFQRYLPQLDYYREYAKELEEEVKRLVRSDDDVFDELQMSGKSPLRKRSAYEGGKRFNVDQWAAYKVACEFLREDKTWRTDWGLSQSNVNNGKRLITLGGMYPIVSLRGNKNERTNERTD